MTSVGQKVLFTDVHDRVGLQKRFQYVAQLTISRSCSGNTRQYTSLPIRTETEAKVLGFVEIAQFLLASPVFGSGKRFQFVYGRRDPGLWRWCGFMDERL